MQVRPVPFPLLIVALGFALCGAVAAETESPPFGLALEPYDFAPLDGDTVSAELGHITVPENRAKPDGKKLQLAFVRFPCTSETCGSPLVYLAGGPGGSGIGTARFNRFAMFMAMR